MVGAVVVIVMSSVAPTGSEARVHVTVWPATPHVQFVPLAEMPVKPTGTTSVTVTALPTSGPVLRGARVNVAALLPIIGDGDALFVMRRSAPGVTATEAVVVLLLGLPSAMPEDSVAVLVMLPLIELCRRATMLRLVFAPLASGPALLHVRVLPGAEQLHPVPDDDTYVVFGGKVSVIVNADAVSGPALLAVSEKVTSAPAATGFGEPEEVSCRSAPELTVVGCVRLLLVSPGVVELAKAVLLNKVPPGAVTFTTMSIRRSVSAVMEPMVHVTFGALYTQLPSDADTNVSPLGIGTVSTMPLAGCETVLTCK